MYIVFDQKQNIDCKLYNYDYTNYAYENVTTMLKHICKYSLDIYC